MMDGDDDHNDGDFDVDYDDKNKGMCCTGKTKNIAFNTLLYSLLVNKILQFQLIQICWGGGLFDLLAVPYTELRSHAPTTLFPSTDLKLYIAKYRFIRSFMYYVL